MQSKFQVYPKGAKRFRAIGATIAAMLFAVILSTSCATKLPPIPEDISSAEIIQKAQERSDINDWKGAQYYYKALLEKFPNDQALVVTAMYELAFIEYKQGHYEAARAGFTAVLEKYAAPEGSTLPQTWKILAEKVMAKLPSSATK
ncbi:MAG: tetratricopeptide repeat protein [Spirochaetales bacterium]|jgi:outer membrane protein assembly factor BamD (BamD/ComL family)